MGDVPKKSRRSIWVIGGAVLLALILVGAFVLTRNKTKEYATPAALIDAINESGLACGEAQIPESRPGERVQGGFCYLVKGAPETLVSVAIFSSSEQVDEMRSSALENKEKLHQLSALVGTNWSISMVGDPDNSTLTEIQEALGGDIIVGFGQIPNQGY
jgi:hypothetical protein